MKDTFLQFIKKHEGKKKQVRLNAYCVVKDKLEGTRYKLTTEIAQKSRDSMLLIGARVQVGLSNPRITLTFEGYDNDKISWEEALFFVSLAPPSFMR
jgi:hypothetical protein